MAADPERIFKTAWFAKASKKARIPMKSFARRFGRRCSARPTMWAAVSSRSGSAETCTTPDPHQGTSALGLCLSFAKKDRANIEQDELASFRALAGPYARKTDEDFDKEKLKELVEICR